MSAMGGIKGGVGSFLLRRTAAKSIRQKHFTGPQFYKRKTFNFPIGHHQLHRRVAPALQTGSPTHQREHQRYAHLPGDARTRPSEDFTFSRSPSPRVSGRSRQRVDKAMYAWAKRGSLQLYQMGGKRETFACYRCGYPVRSALVAIKDDNWDYRMCYNCYTKTVDTGMERNT
ncbi:conserved hypothetical protein [Leishmania major strain Friedlin]|uniref:LIM zinc-binding domain-containing protein n=1 Tax=Leishmania major TaxID=5664 RepID=Q4QD89_LEIMA|nr:conserved hypothetical protein [Leishmania major strain Friedlin]CAG9572831.1 hypothetical_protein_-_conserved [Leishmania major strain Friedlin]CAJ07217.1 conserved hypothetical protein [Leishmania major strain Friedlin]|eukprot:XP_001682709.1 conserved hypothetical protein [Leishmania major strain Friedlin]